MDEVWISGSRLMSAFSSSAWRCSSCSHNARCMRGQDDVWSLKSSDVGDWRPACCTPCESAPAAPHMQYASPFQGVSGSRR